MIVYTAPLFYPGADAVDVALGTDDPVGRVLAPMLGESLAQYHMRLFGLSQVRGRAMSALLEKDFVTITCACLSADGCHRTTLALALLARGAMMGGERPRDLVPFDCGVMSCVRRVDAGQALCAEHWCMLPFDLQRDLLANYTENQRYTGLCTPEWMRLMGGAMACIRETENGLPDYLAEERAKQNKTWATMAAKRTRKGDVTMTGHEYYKAMWDAIFGERYAGQDDLPAAMAALRASATATGTVAPCTFGATGAPPVKPATKPRKRGGWKFEDAK